MKEEKSVRIYNTLFREMKIQKKLSSSGWRIFYFLISKVAEDGLIGTTIAEIEKETELTKNSVLKTLKLLESDEILILNPFRFNEKYVELHY